MTTITVQAAALPPSARHENKSGEWRATLFLLGPALTFLALMAIWPFLYLIYASFTSYQLAIPIPIEWVGLDNFTRMMWSPRFWSSLGITAIFALVAVPLQIAAGLGHGAASEWDRTWPRIVCLALSHPHDGSADCCRLFLEPVSQSDLRTAQQLPEGDRDRSAGLGPVS